jgi:hypothetical protein
VIDPGLVDQEQDVVGEVAQGRGIGRLGIAGEGAVEVEPEERPEEQGDDQQAHPERRKDAQGPMPQVAGGARSLGAPGDQEAADREEPGHGKDAQVGLPPGETQDRVRAEAAQDAGVVDHHEHGQAEPEQPDRVAARAEQVGHVPAAERGSIEDQGAHCWR